MKIYYNKKDFPRDQLIEFLEAIKNEQEYFLYNLEDILESKVLILEEKDGRIVGIAGFRPFSGILGKFLMLPVAYVGVLKEFQGQSIGSRLFSERYREAQKKHSFLINTTSKANNKMLNLMKKLDYKILAESKDRYYFFKAFNTKGQLIFYLLKPGMWLLVKFRR